MLLSPTKLLTPGWLQRLINSQPLLCEKLKVKGNGNLELKADIQFDGEITAEASDGKSDESSPLRLKAYTGKLMELGGWPYPVVVDLKGARFDKRTTPILADHKTSLRVGHTTEQIILKAGEKGTLGTQKIVGPYIGAMGIPSSSMEIARGTVKDLRAGFPFQVSIGARVVAATFIDEGETIYVNGQTFEGPIIVATRSLIRELSVVVLGADNDTSTVIAARLKKEIDMEFEEWLKSLNMDITAMSEEQITKFRQLFAGKQDDPPAPKKRKKIVKALDPDDDDVDDDDDNDIPARRRKTKKVTAGNVDNDDDIDDAVNRQDRIDAELDRRDEIRNISNRFAESGLKGLKINGKEFSLVQARQHAIREKWTTDKFELECRRAEYPDLEEGGPAIHSIVKDVEAKALECAILRQSMCVPSSGQRWDGGKSENGDKPVRFGLEAMYDEKTLEASHGKQYAINNSIGNLLALQVQASGRNLGYLRGRGNDLMAEAYRAYNDIKASGFSTLNIVNVLENVMHKAAFAGFEMTGGVWRQICARRPLNDFKVHALYYLDYQGHFRKVATDGELKHISMVDGKKTIQAETYGAMLTIDRKTRRNDDLGMVVAKARGFGVLGAQRIEEAVFVLFLSNPGSFFAAGNGNLITGAGSALGLAALETAQVAFKNQVINGKPINVGPTMLLHGTNQSILAGRLWRETRTEVTTTVGAQTFADNPFAGLYRPVESGYLNNTSITDQDGNAISGQSQTASYLLANPDAPQGGALVIGFLDGRETPYFDEEETQFNIPGGIQMRSYFDFGLAMWRHQMALKMAGA